MESSLVEWVCLFTTCSLTVFITDCLLFKVYNQNKTKKPQPNYNQSTIQNNNQKSLAIPFKMTCKTNVKTVCCRLLNKVDTSTCPLYVPTKIKIKDNLNNHKLNVCQQKEKIILTWTENFALYQQKEKIILTTIIATNLHRLLKKEKIGQNKSDSILQA